MFWKTDGCLWSVHFPHVWLQISMLCRAWYSFQNQFTQCVWPEAMLPGTKQFYSDATENKLSFCQTPSCVSPCVGQTTQLHHALFWEQSNCKLGVNSLEKTGIAIKPVQLCLHECKALIEFLPIREKKNHVQTLHLCSHHQSAVIALFQSLGGGTFFPVIALLCSITHY